MIKRMGRRMGGGGRKRRGGCDGDDEVDMMRRRGRGGGEREGGEERRGGRGRRGGEVALWTVIVYTILQTCVSDKLSCDASSTRSGVDKYRCVSNRFSSPFNC